MQDAQVFLKDFFTQDKIRQIGDEIFSNTINTFSKIWQEYASYSQSNLDIKHGDNVEDFLRELLPLLIKAIGGLHLGAASQVTETELNRLSEEFFKDKKVGENNNANL